MHKLVLEGYLREELVSSTLDIINAFVRVGPEAEKLLRGLVKVIESFYYNIKINYTNLIECIIRSNYHLFRRTN